MICPVATSPLSLDRIPSGLTMAALSALKRLTRSDTAMVPTMSPSTTVATVVDGDIVGTIAVSERVNRFKADNAAIVNPDGILSKESGLVATGHINDKRTVRSADCRAGVCAAKTSCEFLPLPFARRERKCGSNRRAKNCAIGIRQSGIICRTPWTKRQGLARSDSRCVRTAAEKQRIGAGNHRCGTSRKTIFDATCRCREVVGGSRYDEAWSDVRSVLGVFQVF